jgi:hypothetical protein
MSDKLKSFVKEHRPEFDTSAPGKDLWNKIDAQLEAKNASRISSKWLSGFKYLSFGASMLLVAIYFIADHPDSFSENTAGISSKGREINRPESKALQNGSGSNPAEPGIATEARALPAGKGSGEPTGQATTSLPIMSKDTALNARTFGPAISAPEKNGSDSSFSPLGAEEVNSNSAGIRKKTNPARNSKKNELFIPGEPTEMNSYTATLYEGASFCSVLRVYKFPGKVLMKDGDFHKGSKKKKVKGVLKTTSCSNLADMPNVKAIWLKGKTGKAFTLSIDKKLRNIVLVKSDGRELRPEAISHYYPGLGVITGYTGRFLKLAFKDKVGLILFFKDAEAGDRIIVDGSIEAVVKGHP